ncbi:succinyldiaminopimelate transaminase [Arcanobacterium bovis]|uniref:Succinyldiaminopimelate transaminase n=1 Tax=Arcanobacterium bovis TaxID=2529275 RepID=A0A4V2KRA3_9ACTO|nr:succinyldiaminopimelate transaminase [Arcanobacterium bovis]TBW23654.1 succinyldiaminopimelate transaminase [Arcanobacterium bovis]
MALFGDALADFPWDTLVPIRERAALYPGGIVDLTIGTPVDDVPQCVQQALLESANAHGYPPNVGSAQLHEAIRRWASERNIHCEMSVLPTLGSKEMVALLPAMLGMDSLHKVAYPLCAYPTYDVGARLAGADAVALDTSSDPAQWPADIDLLWLNSPGNPDGHVLNVEQLVRIVAWARAHNVVIASDECYSALIWDVDEAPSILDERVCGGDSRGLIALYSLSKQSNMAGYRAAFAMGDPSLVDPIVELRKHAGFMMPIPVQRAMVAALADSEHVRVQREVYRRRREKLVAAVEAAGLENDPSSVGGLYLWVSSAEGSDAWTLTEAFARIGIVVAPGTFYGSAGEKHIRISLTASDADIASATLRLRELPQALAQTSRQA